jgi:hypothetical protein
MSDDAFEQKKNARLQREHGLARSRTDRAAGFVTCLCCKGWPDVHYWTLKRKADRYWTADCPNGNGEAVRGATRDECKARWNEKHRRWNDSGAGNVSPQT